MVLEFYHLVPKLVVMVQELMQAFYSMCLLKQLVLVQHARHQKGQLLMQEAVEWRMNMIG